MPNELPFSKSKTTKKLSLSEVKTKTWEIYSIYIRLRDAIETTGTPYYVLCCTCGKKYPAFGKKQILKDWGVEVQGGTVQAGHYIPGRGNAILFDDRCVHAQCYHCNHHLAGNWVEYEKYIIKKYGHKINDKLKFLKGQSRNYSIGELLQMQDEYKNRIEILKLSHVLKTGSKT